MVELTWEGKYNTDGKRVAPVRLALPFQDVETVNESAQTRNLMLDLFARNQPREWRNRLIWGDKKYVLPSAPGQHFGGHIVAALVADRQAQCELKTAPVLGIGRPPV